MKKFLYNWAPVLAYLILIFVLSSLPLHAPGRSDKIFHVLEFLVLGFLTTRGILLTFDLSRPLGILAGGGLAALFGILDEIHQLYVPSRQASIGDALADSMGGWLGAACFVYVGILLLKHGKVYSCDQDSCG